MQTAVRATRKDEVYDSAKGKQHVRPKVFFNILSVISSKNKAMLRSFYFNIFTMFIFNATHFD